MKILYVATERGAAEAAARTLRGTAQNVTLTWTETPAAALKWIQYNRDAGAVIVDADTQGPGCSPLLEQIRHRGITTPLAVIAPEHLRGLLLAFNGERDAALAGERERTRLLEARLGEIEEWRRQAHLLLAEERTGRDAALARTARICTALQERLLELETAARTADERPAEQVATIERLAGREAELCAEAAEAMAARTAVEHQLAEAAAAERQAHQRAAEALAEAGERDAAAKNQLTLETAARTVLEERLAAVEYARQVADQTHATESDALAAQFAEREAQHNASSARSNKICTGLQQRLLELEDAIRAAGDRHTVDMTAAETARQHAAVQHAAELTSLTARLADLESQYDAETLEKVAFERQLRDTVAALEDARRERLAEAAASSERLTLRETELGATLSEATAARMAVEATLAAAESAHQTERQRWQADLAGAADTLARRETELGDALAAAVAARAAVERRLVEADAERERAQASADAALTAATERHALDLARLQQEATELGATLSEATAARMAVEATLAAAESAHQIEVQRWQSDLAGAADTLARRETELGDALAAAVAARAAVERRLAEADAERERAQASADAALTAATERHALDLARLQQEATELGATLSEATAARMAVEATLAAAESAHQIEVQRWQSDLAGAADTLARRETELGDALAAAIAARAAVERRLVEADAERERAQASGDAALTAAEERHALDLACLRQEATELGATLSEATAARMAVEATLAAAESAHQIEVQRWQSDLADAADTLARRETELGDALAAAVAARAAVERRLAEADAERERAQASADAALTAATERHALDLARLQQEATELGATLSEATAARMAVEATLAAAESAHQIEVQRWQSDLAGAADTLARREAELGDALAAAVAARAAVERRLAEADAERERAQASADAALTAATERHALDLARLQQEATELGATLSEATAARMAVEATLAAAESAHQIEVQRWQSDLAGAADTLARREAELGDALAAAVAARAAVERRLAEADAERERAQASADAALTAAAERHALDLARLQHEAEDLRRQLDTMRTHAAALRRDLERVPALQRQLEESLHENRRQFERAPYGLSECTRDGAVIRVNHSLARLLGYRSGAELQSVGFGPAVFECADDLRLLLERAVATGKLQSVETLFKTRDSGRLNVRLHALSSDESIVIAVEDLTKLCAVEQRLREAHRMEAVGRVASEVAVTCDTLLRDVTRGGQRWLAGLESDTSLRHQGEQLLDDVTRAAGYLRQFVAYGNKAISSLEPVSVTRMLHEMEPMLKRVLGSDISLSLPKPARAFEVDVESETVQRIFVNVANYARERMAHGGRMKIDLATTVVDQRFLVRHPEVRPGDHVLVRITEVQEPLRGLLPADFAIDRAAPPPFTPPASDKPGMDLGPLMAIISDIGGHLWMAAEPGGNLTLEIRIPARAIDPETAAVPGSRGSRSRQIARWFRH